MKQILAFNRIYFLLTVSLLVIEILIAKYVDDNFIRPYVGDFLVVILIYCFIKSFINVPVLQAALGVLLFSFLVETLQYFHVVDLLGLGSSKLARIIIGTSFEWADIVAYLLGIVTVLLLEYLFHRNNTLVKEKTKTDVLKDNISVAAVETKNVP